MAQKRMFDKRVVESDKFLDLPNSSKALYFMAGMNADDKGFFQPRMLQKLCGFTDDDFKILIAKGYFIAFESGVLVITDWNKNNWLDSRRIQETEYIDELNMLKLINEKYELNNTCLASAKQMLRENRIEENRIEENIDDDNISDALFNIIDYFNNNIHCIVQREYEELIKWEEIFSDEMIKQAIDEAVMHNAKNMKYISATLRNWDEKGYKIPSDIQPLKNKKEKINREEWLKDE